MKNTRTSLRAAFAAALSAAALLSACGGNDYNNTSVDPTAAVPTSASASVGGFIAYLQALVVSAADALEPVDTSMVTAPTDETSEPTVVN